MNRISVRHNVYATILLMVMMLQVGVKTFHVHHPQVLVKIECDDCNHHKVHDGHLINWDGQNDECMLCQLLSAQYVAAVTIHPDAVIFQFCQQHPDRELSVCQGQWLQIRQRGPPAYLS